MASLAEKIVKGKSQGTEIQNVKTLLMERYGISEAAAYKRLAAQAKQENLSVQEIARLILSEYKR
ncbi:MAG TPA: ANTAR domain-containing protein [Bacillota bacterium]|nr:ANTAR domain-containing protein [Bacillota bacterium]HPL52670.1 ANTAR domain-containing protein [Bacillota bacterium]